MAPGYAFAAQLGIGAADPVDTRFDFQSETLGLHERIAYLGGLRGTRSKPNERNRVAERRVSGGISLQPNAAELAALLPWIFGAVASGTTYALADTLPYRYVTKDCVTKVFTYSYCLVNRATFRASQGTALALDLDIVGVDETVGNAASFPSLSIDTATGPFMLQDLAMTIAGSTYQCKDWTLVIDNHVDADRLLNSQTLSSAYQAQERDITFRTMLPYGDASAVYNAGSAGAAVVATFTNGTVSCAFSMVKVAFPRETPTTPPRGEFMLPIAGQAFSSGATKELITTLDSTV